MNQRVTGADYRKIAPVMGVKCVEAWKKVLDTGNGCCRVDKTTGGAGMKVLMQGKVVAVRSMEPKPGKEAMDSVSVLTDGQFGPELVKAYAPRGLWAVDAPFKAVVDVSVFQNRLSVRQVEPGAEGKVGK